MSDNRNIEWRRLLLDGAAIVVSILLAFSIDAWWDDHNERVEERRILDALKLEFQSNAEAIPAFILRHQQSASHAQALLEALKAIKPDGVLQYPAARVGQALGHNSTDPQSGALDAILQSGELRYISNPAIRERLSAWPQLVVDATENEYMLRHIWDPKLLEALAKDVDLTVLDNVNETCWDDPMSQQCEVPKISLPRNTLVMAYLSTTAGWALEAARELGLLVEEANSIVELIESEIAEN